MRTLVLVLVTVVLGGCAAKNANTGEPQPSPQPMSAMEAVQLRACESCRHNLETCRQRRTNVEDQSGASSECMNEFMACLGAQQLDSVRCQGLN
jgi:hypothetical protein